jgi:acyl-CoA synthetase (AMP-forming)/AMP-acid ligase II/acyl carrier protein
MSAGLPRFLGQAAARARRYVAGMAALALSDILLDRAETQPDAIAYEAIGLDGEVRVVSYAQVAARAAALAAQLDGCGDGPALLAYPAGPDYAIAVFAGFLAGRPVVPAYPPGTSSPDRARLSAIVTDARPAVVIAPEVHQDLAAIPAALSVPGGEADATSWGRPHASDRQGIAVIQYTSGSTSTPKGVLVRHDSLAANTAAIAERFQLTADSRGLTWLPPYHDMGLVGGLLTPVAAGIPVRILAPADFLKSPLSWLRQIAESGATVSGAPNFAYDLCVRSLRDPARLQGIDLSRWQVAFSGGERVSERTLAQFTRTFSVAGFHPEAFVPCYGLAEATLMVSAGRWSGQAADGAAVACGAPVAGQRVAIVDPDRLVPADGEGEIWVSGPHVTDGYLSGDSASLFGELGGVRYLRTGDLGRWRGDELVVTGRIKDVIVYRGVNYHAQDLESAALDAAGPVGRAAAAFAIDSGPDLVPALVLEVRGRREEALAEQVRTAVLARTGLRLTLVALVRPQSVPRTSSGKTRRSACRDAFLAGAFADAVRSGDTPPASTGTALGRASSPAQHDDVRDTAAAELAVLIGGIAAEVCQQGTCGTDRTLADLGMDSVRAAEAAAVLESALGLAVPLEAVLGAATPREAAGALVAGWAAAGIRPGQVIECVLAAAAGQGAA